MIRNLLIVLTSFVFIFLFAKKNALPAPGWAVPFTIIFLDFISFFWHFLSHRWRTGNYFHSNDAVAHLTDVWQSLTPRLLIVWGMRLPIEGLLLFEFIIVFGHLLEIGLTKCPSWVERFLAGIIMTPALMSHHYTMIKGKPSRKNFGIVFSFWDRIFGTYVTPYSHRPEVVMTDLR
ncbi:MAG: sterol desaturase family protein [Bdellovibrio sp.]|nr:sterol desaturase family protein [Bdellovibrio sp.]